MVIIKYLAKQTARVLVPGLQTRTNVFNPIFAPEENPKRAQREKFKENAEQWNRSGIFSGERPSTAPRKPVELSEANFGRRNDFLSTRTFKWNGRDRFGYVRPE